MNSQIKTAMMRKKYQHTFLSLFTFLFLSLSTISAQKFEGQIIVENTIPHTLNGVFTLKKEKAMIETSGPRGEVKMITNSKTGEKITVTEINGDTIVIMKNSNDMQYRNLNKKYQKRRLNIKNVMVKVTRETKRINGYKCYKVTASDSRFEGEAWITKKLGFDPYDIFPVIKSQQQSMPRVAKALQNSMEGFVMEMTIKNIKTKKENKLQVTINKTKIDDRAFVINTENIEVYNEEKVRELMKSAKGNPDKMRMARTLLAQIRMQ